MELHTALATSRRLIVLAGIAALMLTPVASSHYVDYYSQTIYAWDDYLAPVNDFETPGWNTRTENAACRSYNSGQMSVRYVATNNQEVVGTVALWTNCTTGAYALITQNGYYKSRCWNDGEVTFQVRCDSWNYHSD